MKIEQKIPSADTLIEGLRSIGYSFQTAVADVIDNSIAAYATEVRIFYSALSDDSYFEICDNGKGMAYEEFNNALAFGTKKQRLFNDKNDLGRFGLGLKTASLSQCKRLTVITKQNGSYFGAYWDVDDIIETNSWQITFLDDKAIKEIPNIEYLEEKNSGTIVLWRKFDKIEKTTKNFSSTFHSIVQNDVLNHCALVFHRFSETMPIFINNVPLPKRDPFLDDFHNTIVRPEMKIPTTSAFPIVVRAYRMPAENDLTAEEATLLGGKNSLLTDDGLYIYRNNRLIAWGSWMRLEHRNLYTHLARIKIDIPSSIDNEWSLDVKKSMAIIPDSIKEKLRPVIIDGIGQSTKRTRYTGQKESDYGIDRVWNRVTLENNKVKYELNQDYPLLQQFKDSLTTTQKTMFAAYMKDVIDFVPAGKMRDDVADSLMAINGTQNETDDLKQELFSLLDSFSAQSIEQAIDSLLLLLSSERFSKLKDSREQIVKEFRKHYGSK